MRSTLLLVALLAGCAPRTPEVITRDGAWSLNDLLRQYPIAAGANIRAELIARTPATSVHLVQIRGGESPHRHMAHDLTVTLLRGEGRVTLDGAVRPMVAGDVVVIPRGAAHFFMNTGRDVAVSFAVYAPPMDAPDTVPVASPADVDSAQVPR
jgi:quercetin dioxygenase-like cupin family protein